MPSTARTIACKSLIDWTGFKKDPHEIIAGFIDDHITAEDAAFARELFFGTIKLKRKIDHYISSYIKSKNLENKLKQVLRLGFYQLIQTTNIPDYAVVSETVELAKQFGSAKQAGFVNAVMREYLRNREHHTKLDIEKNPVAYLGIEYSYPDWLVKKYLSRFGIEKTKKILVWGNTPPGLFFFINRFYTNDTKIENLLNESNIEYQQLKLFPGYYRCLNPHNLFRSNLFNSGAVIIGDPAQSLAVKALDVPAGETVLDLCAAPGGKTAAIAGRVGSDGQVIAVDISYKRITALRCNLSRWHIFNTFVICCDALRFASRGNFRYILADVPCGGTGTIRRNPDLRWNLKEQDIQRHAERQAKLIQSAANILSSKGRLIYSTCSLEPEENSQIIHDFLKQNRDFRLKKMDGLKSFKIADGMYEIIPYQHQTDGAFIAVIEKD